MEIRDTKVLIYLDNFDNDCSSNIYICISNKISSSKQLLLIAIFLLFNGFFIILYFDNKKFLRALIKVKFTLIYFMIFKIKKVSYAIIIVVFIY